MKALNSSKNEKPGRGHHEDNTFTHREMIQHYNQDDKTDNGEEEEEKGCIAAFSRFDDKYLRPFLVYKYERIRGQEEFEIADVLDEIK